MNYSMQSADRATHLKVVIVALVAAIAITALGISSRASIDNGSQTAAVVKASKNIVVTSNASVIH